MSLSESASRQSHLAAVPFFLAPLIFSLSTFFWKDGEYGIIGGTLVTLSMIFWIPVMYALFGLIKEKMPWYYHIGLGYALYGCVVGGTGFGFLGFFSAAFELDHDSYLARLAAFPLSSNLLLFWSGPAFPLSLLVLAIVLIRQKKISTWLGLLLISGAIAFPVSRISRINYLAHAADILLALPLVFMGVKLMLRKPPGWLTGNS